MNNLISIITTIYNGEAYLPLCVEGIIDQDYKNWELLLVDDGSTDRSLEICYSYAKKDSRIRVFELPENKGQPTAMNLGLENARGELITFHDCDDKLHPSTYLSAIQVLQANPDCDIVQFPVYWEYSSAGSHLEIIEHSPINNTRKLLEACVFSPRSISWIKCDKIFKRELVIHYRFKEGVLFEDNLMIIEMLCKSNGICFSTDGMYYFYLRSEAKKEWPLPKRRDLIIIYGEIISRLQKQKHPVNSIIAEFAYRITNLTFRNLTQFGINDEPVKVSIAGFQAIKWGNIWRDNRLSLKAKTKISIMKIMIPVIV